uniref:Uncharacterized protein MANES_15G009600 n=1 Tax=Rhizophora mucronata TaxID=61149 RepID=A0A2P2IT90_RHIMU
MIDICVWIGGGSDCIRAYLCPPLPLPIKCSVDTIGICRQILRSPETNFLEIKQRNLRKMTL